MIRLENIKKVFYTKEVETRALDDVSLTVIKGEFVSIMGPSGCGKSTLLNIMSMLDQPTEGRVFINSVNVAEISEQKKAELRNRTLGFIFQSFHLIPALNIIDNVELPLLYRKGVSAKERRERATAALKRVDLPHRIKHYPSQLSGGQCQRVAIARAIVGQPEILLADEPTGNLDSRMGEDIIHLLHDINKSGTTIVMVTHDTKMASYTHRILGMLDGRIIR
ncbi:MAG: ABC transporter ATP-binding protein [Dysgonamonadaceae bacterium]|jgi:putative ABC transport system ATP-binding protein|nr:ABC transporter ATP-binding protein [Dysgonamonadaceae bacterium]